MHDKRHQRSHAADAINIMTSPNNTLHCVGCCPAVRDTDTAAALLWLLQP
jgi:hypothetical protein